MKEKILFLVLVLAFLGLIFYNLSSNAQAGKGPTLTLEEKIDAILAKQDEILSKLDEIKEELVKLKIRISRNL